MRIFNYFTFVSCLLCSSLLGFANTVHIDVYNKTKQKLVPSEHRLNEVRLMHPASLIASGKKSTLTFDVSGKIRQPNYLTYYSRFSNDVYWSQEHFIFGLKLHWLDNKHIAVYVQGNNWTLQCLKVFPHNIDLTQTNRNHRITVYWSCLSRTKPPF